MLQTILKKALRICSPITLFAFLVYCYLKRRNFLGSFQKQSTLVQSKKIITISTKNILLWNASSDPTQPIIAFKESAIAFLKSLLKTSDWSPILISVISSDQEEVAIQQLLHSTGLYSNGLDPKKVLFCSTKEGVVHITRHINPKLHMDTNVDTVAALAPHLTRCIYVQNSKMDSFHNELRRSSSSLNDFPHTTTANSLDQVDLTNQSTSVDLGASESPKTRVSSPTIDPKLKSLSKKPIRQIKSRRDQQF
ncbi:hypothetical protein BC833DRAFT_603799 [Globomyces pollinis-pini]|nr:hypothetical protein BC833DRAFT_603799 [Globomyces pollinis-pini]